MDREAVHERWERDRQAFHAMLAAASADDLRRPSQGTRWTNQELLFHLLFGYQVVRALLPLVRLFSRLPDAVGHRFARVLDAGTAPFDVVNYLGSCGGALIGPRRMQKWFDRIIAGLHRSLDSASDSRLRRGMHYPTRWDPFFRDYMTVADIFEYPARHFAFHERQLTLPAPR